MSDFIELLSECLSMEKDEFNFETQDDDFVSKEEFIQRVNEIVVKYSSGNVQNEFMAFFFE